jgi:hypothetical protein
MEARRGFRALIFRENVCSVVDSGLLAHQARLVAIAFDAFVAFGAAKSRWSDPADVSGGAISAYKRLPRPRFAQ